MLNIADALSQADGLRIKMGSSDILDIPSSNVVRLKIDPVTYDNKKIKNNV